jgi:hypothetical protein
MAERVEGGELRSTWMEKIGAWQVGADGPVRLGAASIELEKHLENWIENEPQLVGDGLQIISRQLTVEGGGRLDLLAVDPQGRLVVIEVKRSQLEDLALTQALTYAALLAREGTDQLYERIAANAAGRAIELPADLRSQLEMPEGELRDVISVVVGAGMGVGVQALLDYLSGRFGVPLRAVSFQVFGAAGSPLLVREIAEVEQAGGGEAPGPRYSLEAVLAAADGAGVGPAFRAITATIQRHDVLHPRPFAVSVMCAPAANRARALFTYSPTAGPNVSVFIAPDAFQQFLGVETERIHELLQEAELPQPDDNGWFVLPPEAVDAFCSFIERIAEESSTPPGQLSPLRSLYRDWWSEFLPALHEAYPGWTAAQAPPADSWITLPAGHSGLTYGVNFCGRTDAEKRLRAELYIDPAGGDASAILDRLEEHRDAIETAFGRPLSWEPLENRRASKIAAYSPNRASVLEREAWPEYRGWLVKAVGDLRHAVAPYLAGAIAPRN